MEWSPQRQDPQPHKRSQEYMDNLIVEGGHRLEGTVEVSGAKNAALPVLAATVLTKEKSVIRNVPHVSDILTMVKILKALGAKVNHAADTVEVDPSGITNPFLTYKLVSTMRGSICFLGPLLARFGHAKVSFPGISSSSVYAPALFMPSFSTSGFASDLGGAFPSPSSGSSGGGGGSFGGGGGGAW